MLTYIAAHLAEKCKDGVWTSGGKLNSSACSWVSAPNANDEIAGYKTANCPAGSIVQSVRWFQIPKYLDDEHVDVYCCPFS